MNEQVIWDFLKANGMSEYGAAGILGNLSAESGLDPKNLQNSSEKSLGMSDEAYVAAVDSGAYTNFVNDHAGFGLAQWTYWSRKQALLDFARRTGRSIGDLAMQLEFLWSELGSYGLVKTLRGAKSVREASDAILLSFERPASVGPKATAEQREKTCAKRAAMSQTFYDQFAGTSPQAPQEERGAMKYSEENPPLVCMQTQSSCYKGTRRMEVLGVLWHSTGANNPTIRRYVQPSDDDPNREELLRILGVNKNRNDWNHVSKSAGLNCWIGKLADGTVATVQTMPWDFRPWGCGSGKKGSCNNGWIQFEICESDLNDPEYFAAVYKEACEITAYLCKLYNIDPHGTVTVNGVNIPTILCHHDSYVLGFGSGHADVTHWFPKFGKSMETARDDVAALLASAPREPETQVCYQVRVTASSGLNCRSTYSTSGAVVTAFPKGTVLTVTKEHGGWGFVGPGWVSLMHTERVEDAPAREPDMDDPGKTGETGETGETEEEDMSIERFKELMQQYRMELQDNDCEDWSREAREWATSNGLIGGTGDGPDGKPNYAWADTLTREQAAVLFHRFAKMMGKA